MINNRQAGRRRGRGGQRSQGGNPGRPDTGNRIDNRARGNAAQLLEKYKSLARDAQMQGDRVNTEYYLQFADHYFRVLNENRSRFEDQQRRAQPEAFEGEEDDDDVEVMADDRVDGYRGNGHGNGQNGARDQRGDRDGGRREMAFQANGHPLNGADDAEAMHADGDGDDEAPRSRRRNRRRETAPELTAADAPVPAAIEPDRLPPSLGVSTDAAPDFDAEPKPRRRRRATESEASAS
ncbi:DUF4167 domain-containing protein [Sphingomonas sp.]|uniref:DUF4167 domain-containing protein n=1 Tax=Sphingomonas sp. TaxID=28214 RepID=UPI001DF5B79B|nr:DUF4167 domain-containing protein [Sphingomonas sp.]MBX9797647.1 DUF4167 domain-containing protein [Sphingomonas sp.]